MAITLFLYALCLILSSLAQPVQYNLVENFVGDQFYCSDKWEWKTFDDPTHGRVNYVDQCTAENRNLTQVTDSKFFMFADSTNVVQEGSRGRDSIRIESVLGYPDPLLVIGDFQHMPEGCATWPAFWTLSSSGPWPHGGEIDIVEGVNLNTQNLASLHTSPYCTVDSNRDQTGSTVSTNCDAKVNYNQGCGTSFDNPSSYGSPFNSQGGGYYVMEKNADFGVKIWFWPRSDDSVPPEIKNVPSPGIIITTANFGTPAAFFPTGTSCDYRSHFDAHRIVINLTFCGDWAGSVFNNCGGCGMTCEDFVNNSPSSFTNAYWEINSLRVYGSS